nr:MAG TPA: hypothetical protein [Caudoviricetes sp.]
MLSICLNKLVSFCILECQFLDSFNSVISFLISGS